MKKAIQIIVITIAVSCFVSCKKDKIIASSSAKLNFSQPSILFDTVFTRIGSTTKLFRVHNPNNGEVNISSISLARGSASFYKLNVDGAIGSAGTVYKNNIIAAKDSMYIFVQVTIDPNFDPITSPFIYRDSIIFQLNGNIQYFPLIAYGQNAYYHIYNQKQVNPADNTQAFYYDTLHVPSNGTDVWLADKPHLIWGWVVVDSLNKTLVINPGAKIYVHNGGGIWVYRYSTIKIEGTQTNPITFQGDRLEPDYKDVPGQWDRIWINEGSIANTINYAIIKNAYIGVHAGYSAFDGFGNTVNQSDPKHLSLTNTIIQNCSYAGILGHFYNITGGNDVVVNCGQHLLEFDDGGNYTFYQCTFANYWNQTNNSSSSSARTTPSFLFNNYFNGSQPSPFNELYFGNCIFDGTLAEEFAFDTLAQSGGFTVPYSFNYCALKTGLLNANSSHTYSCEINQPMRFISPSTYNFDIPSNSAAWGAGGTATSATGGYFNDINGNAFNASGNPNMGAYAN
ncbi:MAG: hypothetical protein ACYDCN_09490 [Bacteroidia bacterium]